MALFLIKLAKALCFTVLVLIIVLILHSLAHFKLRMAESVPRNLRGLLWPDPLVRQSQIYRQVCIDIRCVNLFLAIFSFLVVVSFTLGNVVAWLIEGNPNGVNMKIVAAVIGIGLLVTYYIVRAYTRYVSGQS